MQLLRYFSLLVDLWLVCKGIHFALRLGAYEPALGSWSLGCERAEIIES